MVWTRLDARIQKSGRSIPKPGRQNPNLGRKSIGMVVNPDTCFVAPFMKGPDGGIICTTGYIADKAKKRFIDSYLKSIYPESLGRAWTLGGPSVPPSLVRRSGSPDLLVRSDGEFSAVEGMPLESSLSKASQKSNTTERKKRQGQLGGGLGLPVKIPDDAYGADSIVYSRSLRQIGIGARSLLSGTLDGLSLGLAKPGTTLSDYLGLPKPEKGTPEELVSGLIRGAADMAPAIYSRGQTWQRPQQRIQKLKCSENILRLLLTCRPGWGDWRDFSMSWEKLEVINTVSRRLQYSTGSEYQHQRY